MNSYKGMNKPQLHAPWSWMKEAGHRVHFYEVLEQAALDNGVRSQDVDHSRGPGAGEHQLVLTPFYR